MPDCVDVALGGHVRRQSGTGFCDPFRYWIGAWRSISDVDVMLWRGKMPNHGQTDKRRIGGEYECF